MDLVYAFNLEAIKQQAVCNGDTRSMASAVASHCRKEAGSTSRARIFKSFELMEED
jgi:hypothetical protein